MLKNKWKNGTSLKKKGFVFTNATANSVLCRKGQQMGRGEGNRREQESYRYIWHCEFD